MTEPAEVSKRQAQDHRESDWIYQRYFEAVKARAEEVKEEYQSRTIIQDEQIEDPVKQQRNSTTEATCLIATAINAMKALKVRPTPTEDEVLAEILTRDSFRNTGELSLIAVLDYLDSRGLKNTHTLVDSYPKELVKGILDGGVVIECVTAKGGKSEGRYHAKLLSGIRIEDGHILFREYDPDPKEPLTRLVPLDTYISEVYGVDDLHTATLLKHSDITG